ncbi:YciI family protein [Slackia heliotrinireducens]|uniref:YciI family protein n=1 Tax=Slackia heliotrinireducens TaxID=84110 RepID=UPI003314BFE3
MHFMILAYDGTDEGALDRRMKVRPQHLENIRKLNEAGHVISAGGLTNAEGKLIGSVLLMDFESREQLDEYLAGEPYVTGGAWEDIKVETCNVLFANPLDA